MNDPKQLHRIIEGALFASSEPLSVDRIAALFAEDKHRPEKKEITLALQDVMNDYNERGIELKQLASGYQFQVKADLAKWVKRLWEEKPPRYSRALLETLVLIAYRQPVTRGEIEEVRGVGVSSSIMKTLLEREWVKVVGHRDVPGKPGLYATTKAFLDYFGLKSLADLPPLTEVRDLEKLSEKLQQQMDVAVAQVVAEENLVDESEVVAEENLVDESEVVAEENLVDDVAVLNVADEEVAPLEAQAVGEVTLEETAAQEV